MKKKPSQSGRSLSSYAQSSNPQSQSSQSSQSQRQPYDPLQFIIRARNDNDHSDFVPKTQVTPELKAEIESIAASTLFEFDSTAAFCRWAYVVGIEFLKKLHPEYPSNISIIRAMEREHARLQTRIRFLDHIEKEAKEAFELLGRGMSAEAGTHVFNVLSEIRKMDPADPWRSTYERELKKRFGKLLTRGHIISHVPVPDREPQPADDWEIAGLLEN